MKDGKWRVKPMWRSGESAGPRRGPRTRREHGQTRHGFPRSGCAAHANGSAPAENQHLRASLERRTLTTLRNGSKVRPEITQRRALASFT